MIFKESLILVIKNLIEVMEIQEKRDTEEFHLSAHAFKPIWDEAKAMGREAIVELEK